MLYSGLIIPEKVPLWKAEEPSSNGNEINTHSQEKGLCCVGFGGGFPPLPAHRDKLSGYGLDFRSRNFIQKAFV